MGAGCSMEKGIHEDVLYKQIKEVNYSDADLLKLISDREKKGVVNDFVYNGTEHSFLEWVLLSYA